MNASQMATKIGDRVHDDSLADLAYEYINLAQEKMEQMAWWTHLEAYPPYQFALVAPYTTGTVALATASTAVVGTGTAWTSAFDAQVLQISGDSNYYWIAPGTTAAALTLLTPYLGTTASGLSYTIHTINYALPADLSVPKIKDVTIQNPHKVLDYLDESERDLRYPNLLSSTAQPSSYMNGGDGGSNLQIFPATDAQYLVVVKYQRSATEVSGDQTVLDWPASCHRAILKLAVAEAWKDKDDAQAESVEQEAMQMVAMCLKQNSAPANRIRKLRAFDFRARSNRLLYRAVRVTGDPVP